MITFTVNYYLNNASLSSESINTEQSMISSPILLGTESYSNISQILCPKDSTVSKTTITKFFHGQSVHRWLITDIKYLSDTEIHIYLQPRNKTQNEIFLTKTRKSHPNIIKKIQKGTLVEVEFGYVQQVRRSDGYLKTNKRYPDMLHDGEMHKRRLAIVVNVKGSLVRVVPITSDEQQNLQDKAIFEISSDSLQELIHYNAPQKRSYALCNSMQTIAMSRILPPLSKQENKPSAYRDIRYVHKLAKDDYKQFDAALSASIGCGDYYVVKTEHYQLKHELNSAKSKLDQLVDENAQLVLKKHQLQEIEKRYEALIEIMVDWKRQITSISIENAKAEIHTEIDETIAILANMDNPLA